MHKAKSNPFRRQFPPVIKSGKTTFKIKREFTKQRDIITAAHDFISKYNTYDKQHFI